MQSDAINLRLDEPGRPVTISEGLAVGLLMLLHYLADDWGKLPPEILPVVIRLNNALGHESYSQAPPPGHTRSNTLRPDA